MRRSNVLRTWCLVALLTLPVAAWGGEAGKLKILLLGDSTTIGSVCRQADPDGPHLEDVIRLLLAAEKDLPPSRGHQPGAGRRVHPGPALVRPVRQGDRPPRRRRLRPHPLRPERPRQAGGLRGQLPQGLCRADRQAAPGLPAGDHRPDDDHPLHDPRARRSDQRAHPEGGRVGTPGPVRRVYPLPGRALARAGHAQLPPLPAREDPGEAPRVGQAVRPGRPGRGDGQPARRPFPRAARLVRRSPSQPGRLSRDRRRVGQVPREADPGEENHRGRPSRPSGAAKPPGTGLEFIDTGFENASPLWYETAPDGTVLVHLLYDHERSSPNRAAGHFHFRLHASPGSTLTLEFRNLDNVWNGRKASVADELKAAVVSPDGKAWKSVPLERLPGDRVRLTVTMPGPELYVARVEPYRLSDLEKWLKSIETHPLVEITPIGKTVEGRGLEILRVGRPDAPYRVFLRRGRTPGSPAATGSSRAWSTGC